MKAVPFGPLDRPLYQEIVRQALAEDIGRGDVTTRATVPEGARARGAFMAKAPCVVAGLELAIEAFLQLDSRVAVLSRLADGTRCGAGDTVAEVTGPAAPLLTGERTALNFLQRLSGIATLTRRFVDAAEGRITILDTRKTTPLLRALEKYAVRAGGGVNHRMALGDAILIKDNHARLAGGIAEALRRTRHAEPGREIEIEVQSLAELDEALAAGATFVMLDNLSLDEIRQAVRSAHGRARIEISGNVTLDRLPALAASGADYVSVGALTHSAPAADLSFELEPDSAREPGAR